MAKRAMMMAVILKLLRQAAENSTERRKRMIRTTEIRIVWHIEPLLSNGSANRHECNNGTAIREGWSLRGPLSNN
jgi:hypothetical protein